MTKCLYCGDTVHDLAAHLTAAFRPPQSDAPLRYRLDRTMRWYDIPEQSRKPFKINGLDAEK